MPNNNTIYTIKDYFSRHGGLQRANRFDVSFVNLPGGIVENEDSEEFYPIQDAIIGGRGMEFVADNLSGYRYGRIQPRSQRIPEEVLLTFSIANDNHLLKLFNNWFNYLYSGSRAVGSGNNLTSKFYVPYYNDAVKNVQMKIRLLDPNGNVNTTFTFYEVMPAEGFPIELSMTNDKFVIYKIQMAFKEFRQD